MRDGEGRCARTPVVMQQAEVSEAICQRNMELVYPAKKEDSFCGVSLKSVISSSFSVLRPS